MLCRSADLPLPDQIATDDAVASVCKHQRIKAIVHHSAKPLNEVERQQLRTAIFSMLESARRIVARSVNALMTASYSEIGRNVIEF